jgi:hypothetical protein
MFLVDDCVPKNYTHVLSLGFFEGKDEGVVEVGPKILWLNVCEKDIGIYC